MSFQYENEEEREKLVTPEEYLAEQKQRVRKRSYWAIIIGAFLVIAHLVLFSLVIFSADFNDILTWKDLFRSIFFIIGLFALVGGIWGLSYAKNLSLKDLIPTQEAVEYLRQARDVKLYFTFILVGCIVAVYLAQMIVDSGDARQLGEYPPSIELAGFIKPLFWEGEYWRILTGGALHGMILHLYFNGQALYGFGSLIELLSNRAHLAIVFILAVIGGGFFSAIFMPEAASIGASGGIMGLIGYLAIFGYRRKRQLPPDFLKSMLVNIGFITAFGLIAYQIIDNFAHLGGLVIGAIYGFAQVPRDLHENPRNAGSLTKILGFAALGVFIFTAIFSILLLLEIIKL